METILVIYLLSLKQPMFLSYRNQSVDFQSKSTDWFLYDRDIGGYRFKGLNNLGTQSCL